MTPRNLTVAALVAGLLVGGIVVARPALADVTGAGHYCAKYSNVAVREKAGGAARDNLNKDQTFQVEDYRSEYSYGHKIVNGVHGYVLDTSLYRC